MEAGTNTPVTTEKDKAAQKSRDLLIRSEAEMRSGNLDFAFSLHDQAIDLAQDMGAQGTGNPFGKDTAIDRTLHINYEMGRVAKEELSATTMAERQRDYQAMVKPGLVDMARTYVQMAQAEARAGNEELAEDYEYEAASLARSLGNDGGENPFDEKQDPMLHRQFYKGVAEVEMLPASYQEQQDIQWHESSALEPEPEPFPPLSKLSADSSQPFEQRANKAISLYEQSGRSDIPDTDILYGWYQQSVAIARDIGLDGQGQPNPFLQNVQPELHLEYELAAEYREEQVHRIFGNQSAFQSAKQALTEPDKAKLYLFQSRLEERKGDGMGADFMGMDAVSIARSLGQTTKDNPFSKDSTPLLHAAFFNGALAGNEKNVVLTPDLKAMNTWFENKEAEWKQTYDPDYASVVKPVSAHPQSKEAEPHNVVINDLRHLAETLSDPKKAAKAALIADRMAALDKDQATSPELLAKLQQFGDKRGSLTTTQSKQVERDEELGL